jgi:hypothetical protein
VKDPLAITTLVLAPTLAATFYFSQPADRIPRQSRWILQAESAEIFEMDVLNDPGARPRATIGYHSGKVPVDEGDPFLPTDEGWIAVEEPRKVYRDSLELFREALVAFDAEHSGPVTYVPPIEPRVCVRFSKPNVNYDVYVCLVYKQVLIKDAGGNEVYRGKMEGSYAKFVAAVQEILPHDAQVKFALERLERERGKAPHEEPTAKRNAVVARRPLAPRLAAALAAARPTEPNASALATAERLFGPLPSAPLAATTPESTWPLGS